MPDDDSNPVQLENTSPLGEGAGRAIPAPTKKHKKLRSLLRMLATIPAVFFSLNGYLTLAIIASDMQIPSAALMTLLRNVVLVAPLVLLCEIWKGFTINLTPAEQIRHDRFHRRMAIGLSLLPIIIVIATRVAMRKVQWSH